MTKYMLTKINKGYIIDIVIERQNIKQKEERKLSDAVNHPSHYIQGGLEAIDVIKAFYGENALILWCLINSTKYVLRAPHKNGNEDIAKANFYLAKIQELSNGDPNRVKKIIEALKHVE